MVLVDIYYEVIAFNIQQIVLTDAMAMVNWSVVPGGERGCYTFQALQQRVHYRYDIAYLGYFTFYSSSSTQIYSYFNYTNTLYDVIGTIDRVYYTMQSVAVNAHNYSSPTDSSKNSLDFQVDAVEWGNSYLVSQIKGYVYTNHFNSFGMRYLAILINSQLFSGYVEAVSL